MEYIKRSISLPAETNDKLSKEPNASALIAKLVEQHYAGKQSLAELLQDKSQEQVLESVNELTNEVQRLSKYIERASSGM